MSVFDVTVTFLICMYLLRPMFYMYHVTGKNKVVLYCVLTWLETLKTGFLMMKLILQRRRTLPATGADTC